MESLRNLNFTGRMNTDSESINNTPLTLVLGANGKTGRRVADRLPPSADRSGPDPGAR